MCKFLCLGNKTKKLAYLKTAAPKWQLAKILGPQAFKVLHNYYFILPVKKRIFWKSFKMRTDYPISILDGDSLCQLIFYTQCHCDIHHWPSEPKGVRQMVIFLSSYQWAMIFINKSHSTWPSNPKSNRSCLLTKANVPKLW